MFDMEEEGARSSAQMEVLGAVEEFHQPGGACHGIFTRALSNWQASFLGPFCCAVVMFAVRARRGVCFA